MPTFCRHNRFIERCPICSRTLPGAAPAKAGRSRSARAGSGSAAARGGSASGKHAPGTSGRRARLRGGGREVHVQHEARAQDDGYACELVPGLRASADAERLAREIAFAAGRLQRMHAAPPDLWGEIRALALDGKLERATWICFLAVYLSPLQGDDPFAGVRLVLERERILTGESATHEGREGAEGGAGAEGDVGAGSYAGAVGGVSAGGDSGAESDAGAAGGSEGAEDGGAQDGAGAADGPPMDAAANAERAWDSPLDGIPLGPRTSHDPARGSQTLRAYRQWALQHAGQADIGQQARALIGDESWTPERRFERAFERLALPGFARMGRYELLVTLGRLGLYELRTDSLYLAGARAGGAGDLTTTAAKRVLAVGEPIYLERRALAFARELDVPVEALDLALANWGAGERATLGFRDGVLDHHTLERVRGLLEL